MDQQRDLRLDLLAGNRAAKAGPDCPAPEELAELAAGIAEPSLSDRLLPHILQCDACGAILRGMTEDFEEPLRDAETASLNTLPSAKPAWPREMAAKMARAAGSGRVVAMPMPRWVAKAAAVLVVVGGGWLAWDYFSSRNAAPLLAQAYEQQRPFEYRIPDANPAAVKLTRGSGSSFQRSQALMEAEAQIAKDLAKTPDDVLLLGLRARAEMLNWEPGAAITTLQRALERKPNDPDLNADLGMAYALRAEADKRDQDYAAALNYLDRSLRAQPDSLTTIFNRAIVYEHMQRIDDAAREWRRYLELDPTGGWHDEAQRHLGQLTSGNPPRLP